MIPRKTRRLLAAICASSVLAFQALATVVYLLPDGALRQASPVLVNYVSRYFYQSWHLFSPDVPVSYQRLLVQCMGSDGSDTKWLDPLDSALHRELAMPLGPDQKLWYVYNSVVHNFAHSFGAEYQRCPAPRWWPVAAARKERSLCAQATLEQLEPVDYVDGIEFVSEICRSVARRHSAPPPRSVRLRLVRVLPFPWSKRQEIGQRPFYRAESTDLGPIPTR